VRILVTGATGNVARLVVNHMLQTDVKVRALRRRTPCDIAAVAARRPTGCSTATIR
jgi:uncharacterized protein YbjT (DUF2867 family)